MRFVVVNDPHIRGNNPENRKDDFSETLKSKFKEVVEIAHGFDADYFLAGGDWFDIPIPSMAIAGELMAIMLSTGIPIIGIPGNHDFYAANPITLPRTLLGYTAALGAITLVKEGEPMFLEKFGVKVRLTGQPYHNDIDRRDPNLDYCVKGLEGYRTIHMVHGMLSAGDIFPGDVTLIEEITSTEADITISAHNHLGWGVIYRDGKYFVNPGGLTRLSNHKAEMTRTVGVALIEVTMDTIYCEFRELKSALPGEEVLDRSRVEEIAALEKKLIIFTQQLKQSTDMDRVDVTGIIRQAAADEDVSAFVLNEALRRLAIAEEAIVQRGGFV